MKVVQASAHVASPGTRFWHLTVPALLLDVLQPLCAGVVAGLRPGCKPASGQHLPEGYCLPAGR